MKSKRSNGRNGSPPRQAATLPANGVSLRYVRRVEDLFRKKAEKRITLAEAAVCAGCSERTLQLAFRRCRGMTPMAVLCRIRLEAARAALAGPGRSPSIREIAAIYHFSNPSRFAQRFKEAFGQFPSEFRWAQDPL